MNMKEMLQERNKERMVMLVDDSEVDNYVTRKIMETNKFAGKVLEFTVPREALEYLHENGKNNMMENIPELICLDVNMPVIDGFQFMEKFKELPETVTRNTKIVVLSSVYNPVDIAPKMKSPHIIEYMSKPLMKSNLEKIELSMQERC